ncbi:MAG: terpene cyclase/mutase family protein [Planctomycetaceae bacterium]|jgi:squalene-hopene/tetraprenyl-beta-curcumene cyclase|nr:terpene cyclase/mutase family protein [Planctomycetaceae bacterium]
MRRLLTLSVLCLFLTATLAVAQDATKIRQAVEKGVAFLRSAQGENGGWSASPRSGVGPSMIILAGLLDSGIKPDDPMVEKGLAFIKNSIREDGGVYTKDGFFQNYETCCAVMCFAKANEAIKKAQKTDKGPYDELLANAQKFILKQQYTEERDVKPEDAHYGGVGYGGTTRPDLSNTQFFLDALKTTGKNADDPAIQKALVFVSRCQNLESEHNTMPFVATNAKNLDGGFIYVNQPGASRMESAEESLRSYGAMTYAGLKSMIYAGLNKDDKRVKAAFDWISKHYSVKEHPGRGANGLFYYYHTMSKSLDVLQLNEIETADGNKHAWKTELSEELLSKQKENGSWVNDGSRQWMENDPNLVTGFVLLVLAYCQ